MTTESEPDAAWRAELPQQEIVQRLSSRGPLYARYRMRGEVGHGGMGTVLRIWDEDLRRELAMKVVRPAPAPGASSDATEAHARLLDRFLEEAQVTSQLDHPGIVPVHEMGLDPRGQVYFTMRLVAGRDLEAIFDDARAEREGWTTTRALGALLKVCEAMAYAHSKGVLHRDLKPANVMVGKFGEVYVMDWGLARVLDRPERPDARAPAAEAGHAAPVRSHRSDSRSSDSESSLVTMDGDIVGTPAYMSPEQARGDLATIGPAADIYSTGALLYRLLAGHAPYVLPETPGDAITVWRRVCEGPPEPIHERAPGAPAELIAVCEKAMAREPAQRYSGMQALGDDLRAWLEGRVVRAYETGALAEMRKWIKRNRAFAATAAALIVVVVAGSTISALVMAGKNRELRDANTRIQSSELQARTQAQIAEDRARRILRLSDTRRLRQLVDESAALWPALPAMIPRYEQWLSGAHELADRLPSHAAALDELRQRAASPGAAQAGAAPTWTFANEEEGWQHDVQQELVERLRAFVEGEHGELADVARRLEFARTVEERTVSGPEARARWDEARAAISDASRTPAYAGLAILPQVGLLPLGADRASGLWEFADVQTGELPQRDPASGALHVDGASALVFVLLPGGTFRLGAQPADEDAPNHDALARSNEGPVAEVALAPFLLSKHEMTQGQWLRTAGSNPSIYGPGTSLDGRPVDLSHPVEQVSWTECTRILQQLGCTLPTEAQWEYATRAGTDTPWSSGATRSTLIGAANLADQAAARVGASWPAIEEWPELDDGFSVHAPVGSFAANAFGLHDVHGNVWEWCLDSYAFYFAEVEPDTGLRVTQDERYRVSRGGSFFHGAAQARSAYRNNSAPETRANHLGLRPARLLQR